MNINFHYYAIKAAAHMAGLPEQAAQLLAEYSQFIDDFETKRTIRVLGDIPQWVKDSGIVAHAKNNEIKLVTTGFTGLWNQIALQSETLQNQMLVPFHFITQCRLNTSNYNHPVVPATFDEHDGSLISTMLREQFACYREETSENRKNHIIMKIGMLLHVFADTYAHQRFSGHWNKSCNNYAVAEAISYQNRSNPKNVTAKYRKTRLLPSIGHTTADHAPDDSDIAFSMVHQNDKNNRYERNNVETFTRLTIGIMEQLKTSLDTGKPLLNDEEKKACEEKLRTCFCIDNDDPARMPQHWARQFPETAFAYDKKNVLKRLCTAKIQSNNQAGQEYADADKVAEEILKYGLDDHVENQLLPAIPTTVSDEFYHFTIFAAYIRDSVQKKD